MRTNRPGQKRRGVGGGRGLRLRPLADPCDPYRRQKAAGWWAHSAHAPGEAHIEKRSGRVPTDARQTIIRPHDVIIIAFAAAGAEWWSTEPPQSRRGKDKLRYKRTATIAPDTTPRGSKGAGTRRKDAQPCPAELVRWHSHPWQEWATKVWPDGAVKQTDTITPSEGLVFDGPPLAKASDPGPYPAQASPSPSRPART